MSINSFVNEHHLKQNKWIDIVSLLSSTVYYYTTLSQAIEDINAETFTNGHETCAVGDEVFIAADSHQEVTFYYIRQLKDITVTANLTVNKSFIYDFNGYVLTIQSTFAFRKTDTPIDSFFYGMKEGSTVKADENSTTTRGFYLNTAPTDGQKHYLYFIGGTYIHDCVGSNSNLNIIGYSTDNTETYISSINMIVDDKNVNSSEASTAIQIQINEKESLSTCSVLNSNITMTASRRNLFGFVFGASGAPVPEETPLDTPNLSMINCNIKTYTDRTAADSPIYSAPVRLDAFCSVVIRDSSFNADSVIEIPQVAQNQFVTGILNNNQYDNNKVEIYNSYIYGKGLGIYSGTYYCKNCIIRGHSSAARFYSPYVTWHSYFEQCTFEGTRTIEQYNNQGIAIYLQQGANLYFDRCYFKNSTVFLFSETTVSLSDCVVNQNTVGVSEGCTLYAGNAMQNKLSMINDTFTGSIVNVDPPGNSYHYTGEYLLSSISDYIENIVFQQESAVNLVEENFGIYPINSANLISFNKENFPKTDSGVTVNYLNSGAVLVNGTYTGSNSESYIELGEITVPAGTYLIYGTPGVVDSKTDTPYYLFFDTGGSGRQTINPGDGVWAHCESETTYYVTLCIKSGYTVNNLIFSPTIVEYNNNIKYSSNRLPSPLLSTPISQIGDNLRDARTKLAESLTAQGVSSDKEETLPNLIEKVSSISGGNYYANSVLNEDGTQTLILKEAPSSKDIVTGTITPTVDTSKFEITGLPFEPSRIIFSSYVSKAAETASGILHPLTMEYDKKSTYDNNSGQRIILCIIGTGLNSEGQWALGRAAFSPEQTVLSVTESTISVDFTQYAVTGTSIIFPANATITWTAFK